MTIALPERVVERIIFLATEDEVEIEAFVATLVADEDRRRHVKKRPCEDGSREQCGRRLCAETNPAQTVAEIDQKV